jgi:hypothetical protein
MKQLISILVFTLSLSARAYYYDYNERQLPKVSYEIADMAFIAVLDGDIETLERLLEAGYDPHFSVIDSGNSTIFHYILSEGVYEFVGRKIPKRFSKETYTALQFLVDNGARVDFLDSDSGTAPMGKALKFNLYHKENEDIYSEAGCRPEMIRFLLRNNHKPEKGTRSGATGIVSAPYFFTPNSCAEAFEVYLYEGQPNFVDLECNTNVATDLYPILGDYLQSVGLPRIGSLEFGQWRTKNCRKF